MTQRKTFLPQNKFYSGAHVPEASDEAGASAPAPTPSAPADISVSDEISSAQSSCGGVESGHAETERHPSGRKTVSEGTPTAGVAPSPQATAATDSCQEPVAAVLLQALGALSGTDLIHEIFAVKPKHFKLNHKRRLKLPRFVPDYEAMEAAMHDPSAPRALEADPVWADASPLFLRGS